MPLELNLAVVAVFVAVALLTGLGAWALLNALSPTRQRLQALAGGAPAAGVVLKETTVTDRADEAVKRMARFVPKSPKELGRLRKRLARAGFHGVQPVLVYSLGELVAPVAVGALTLMAFGASARAMMLAAVLALAFYLLPGFVLQHLIKRRQQQITDGLPDAVDLLIVCVEAGSSLDQAVVKASEELHLAYPALAEEFSYLNTEVRAGKPRMEAFKNLAERTKVDDVRALVAMLVQTDRFGTSIAQALRTFADAARTKRRQEAEERAAKLGVKLLFPLVFCLFPALYVVLLGPAAIRILRVLVQNIAGQ